MSHLQILTPPAHCHLHCCGNLPYYKHTTTRLPFLDLHHSDNLQNVPPAPPQTSRTTILYKPTGAAIPPIPPNLVEKTESGAFVEMGPSHLGLDDAAEIYTKTSFHYKHHGMAAKLCNICLCDSQKTATTCS